MKQANLLKLFINFYSMLFKDLKVIPSKCFYSVSNPSMIKPRTEKSSGMRFIANCFGRNIEKSVDWSKTASSLTRLKATIGYWTLSSNVVAFTKLGNFSNPTNDDASLYADYSKSSDTYINYANSIQTSSDQNFCWKENFSNNFWR